MTNQKTNRYEGSGAARMVQMMKQFGHNVDSKWHVATVKSVNPFAIRLPGDTFDITDDLLVISQAILPHDREIEIDGTTKTLSYKEGYVNPNDEVIVVETNDGQRYIVLEKVGG